MFRIPRAAIGACIAIGAPCAAIAADAGNAFNPKISLILDGQYAHYSSEAEAEVPGVVLGPETEFAPKGFSVGETELAIESNIDDQFHGWATVALENEDGDTVVALEEAYINTLALPHGLALKFGRFFSDVGYQNHQHAHAWEFADAPLAYRALLGNQLKDDGLQLRWLAPTDLYLELGGELLRGDGFPAGNDGEDDIGASTAFAHVGGDLGASNSWRLGLWHFDGKASDRRSGEDIETGFSGKSRISGLDLVWKWAPNGNANVRNLVLQAELMRRSEDGTVVSDPDGAADSSAYNGDQLGWYAQAVYQFMPRWRVGLRYDRLSASNEVANPVAGTSLELLANDGEDPQRVSAMVDFSNSEFSRLRLQFNRDESRGGDAADNQVILQYIYSVGAHPAHQF
ncbi:MAG TPA: hypothetical protein VLI06_11270 [Solimonas sp.]|nr:hypothetical protein [Solimonas sp.]